MIPEVNGVFHLVFNVILILDRCQSVSQLLLLLLLLMISLNGSSCNRLGCFLKIEWSRWGHKFAFDVNIDVESSHLFAAFINSDDLLEVDVVEIVKYEEGIPDQLFIVEKGPVKNGKLHLDLLLDVAEGKGLLPFRALTVLDRGTLYVMTIHLDSDKH